MDNRTMVKITEYDNSYAVRTVSRDFHSSKNFYILKSELDKLQRDGCIIFRDIYSYADIKYCKTRKGVADKIQITFSWLSSPGDGTLTGRVETISIPPDSFDLSLHGEGEVKKVLSIPDKLPVIECRSQKNLHRVVENRQLRSKLARFLDKNFRWVDYDRIVLYDDFVPYSFVFDGYAKYSSGICGGIILHGQENLQTAYYSIHT